MNNRIARMIDPEADARSDDYKDGLIAGFHEFYVLHVSRGGLNEEEFMTYTSGCKHVDWCEGWRVGYRVREERWHREQAVSIWENEGGAPVSADEH